jgi:hypothetical protein
MKKTIYDIPSGETTEVDMTTEEIAELSVVVVPRVISMRQAQKALLIAQKLADVETFIASLPGLDGDLVRIDWTKGSEIRRDWPFVETVRLAFGWTVQYMDNFFIEADKL